ncbi:hypothetical protein IAU60_005303 [Kwoniella sp. DSM 27419]
MARPASLLRPLARAAHSPSLIGGSAVQTRTLINAASRSTNTASIDYRILEGVDGFLPKDNFDRLQEWQGGLWERLQGEVRNNPALLETKQKWDKYGLDMTDLISSTARDTQTTLAYNYAALLLNNSFFLEGLTAETPREAPRDFAALKEKVEAYAEGIVGGGWLWIVRSGESQRDLDVIPTFASGTLLVTGRSQRGRENNLPLFAQPPTSGTTTPVEGEAGDVAQSSAPETPGQAPLNKRNFRMASHRVAYPSPLAVLNLYEHAYLGPKYGVWDKTKYAQDWWKRLDWAKVEKRNASV